MMRRILIQAISPLFCAFLSCIQPQEQGAIAVSSIPPGAIVYLDDSLTGMKTNCVLTNVQSGEHKIKLSIPGLPEWSTIVDVKAGDTCEINTSFIVETGKIKWTFSVSTGYYIKTSPSIGQDGTIYYSGQYEVIALNPDGTLKWKKNSDERSCGPMVISENESIYYACFVNDYYRIAALNSDGNKIWEFFPDSGFGGSVSPALDRDGCIYFSAGNCLYALNPEGKLKWKFEIASNGTPTIGDDGTIYVGGDRYLYAFKPDGTLKWVHEPGSTPVIGSDRTLYFGFGKHLYATSQNGTTKCFSKELPGDVCGISIGSEGKIYAGIVDWKDLEEQPEAWSYSFSPSGEILQTFGNSWCEMMSTPTIGRDGSIYFTVCQKNSEGYYSSYLYSYGSDGCLQWKLEGPSEYSSPSIAEDGTLFVTGNNVIYAIQTSSFGLAPSSWPKYGHDNQNTGRAGGP